MATTNGAFIVDNVASYAVPTFNTEATGYSGTNIYNGVPSEVWRSTGVSGIVTYTYGSVQTISGIGLINHNFDSGATITLEFSEDSFSTVAATETITWSSGNTYKVFAPKVYAGIRLTVVVSSGYVELGELILGAELELNPSYYYEYTRLFRENRDGDVMTKGGQYFQSAITEQEGYELDLKLIPESQFGSFKPLIRAGGKVFIPNLNESTCYYGVIADNELKVKSRRYGANGYMDFSLKFWELPNKYYSILPDAPH